MWPWLLKTDPTIVFGVLVSVGTYVWRKIAGDKAQTVDKIVSGAVEAILSEIVDHVPDNVPVETYLKGARDYVERRIWTALGKRGVKPNALTTRLVNAAIEQATASLGKKIAAERRARSAVQ